MTIGKLAAAGGVGVETVRYYQRKGLLDTPNRPISPVEGSVRRYDEGDLNQLRFIRSAQAAGFSLEEIRELLDLNAFTDRDRARELATERIKTLDEKIAILRRMRASLTHLYDSCMRENEGPCPIITAFDACADAEHHQLATP